MHNLTKRGLTLFFLPLFIAVMVLFFSQLLDPDSNNKSTVKAESTPLQALPSPTSSIAKNITFKEKAVSKGIIFKHEHRSSSLSGLADTYGSGVCIIDFNNDGYEDLFIVNGSGVTRRYGKIHWWNKRQGSRLYQNIGGRYFKDVSNKFMTDINNTEKTSGYGCAVDDMNNDGYLDIVLGRVNYVEVLINNAGATFSQQTIKLKANSYSSSEAIWPMSITLWDWNKDGNQDILVANFAKFKNDLKVGSKEYGYNQKTQFDSKEYSGQQNILLTHNVKNILSDSMEFDTSYFDNYDRTLTITPLNLLTSNTKEHSNNLFIANATGSNSYVYSLTKQPKQKKPPINWLTSNIKSPIVQVNSLIIQNKPALVFTQHKEGGVQLYHLNDKSREDLAWGLGLNSEKDNAAQTWASLIIDINNDGLQDIVSARGFIIPHIDNDFKPQGSHNSVKLQNNEGLFSEALVSLNPMLSRSSRGAAYADFNNDGQIDIAFNNNNGFFSLYMNQSSKNNWVSFICEPLFLCRNSHWIIQNRQNKTITQQMFSKPESFLSTNQKRVHFGLGDRDNNLSLEVKRNDDKSLNFSQVSPNNLYRVNLQTNTITLIEKGKVIEKRIDKSHSALAQLLHIELEPLLIMMNENEQLDEQQLTKLSQLLISDKLENIEFSVNNSPEFLTLTSWLLNSVNLKKPNNSILLKNIIRLIGGSESSLFVDYLVELIATVPEENFCQLTDELKYWFKEEEVLPKTKQLLKAPLIHRLTISKSANIVICGLDALSSTRDTTIGSSLVPLLLTTERFNGAEQALIKAATLRALGFLKHSKSKGGVIGLCKTTTDELIKAECIITLYKLGLTQDEISEQLLLPAYPNLIYALHEDKVILDLFFQAGLETIPSTISPTVGAYDKYKKSPQKTHFTIAHLNELLLAKTIMQKTHAIHSLLNLRENMDIETILANVNRLSPNSIDGYVDIVNEENHKQALFLPYVSSNKIVELVKRNNKEVQNFEQSYTLAYQCSIRQTISDICNELLQLNFKMSMDEVETLLATSPIKLIYSLMSANSTLKKVTALRLFNLSSTLQNKITANQEELNYLFSMLRINNSYSLIRKNQISKKWLKAFIESAYQNNYRLDQEWLVQFDDLIKTNETAIDKAT